MRHVTNDIIRLFKLQDKGFTLIEALVVISVLTVMTAFLMLQNRATETQVTLIREKANFIDVVSRAKNLAGGVLIESTGGAVVCGYGVRLADDSYFIYRDLAGDCEASDFGYSGDASGEKMNDEEYNLPADIRFSRRGVDDILFFSPLPNVFFDGQEAISEAEIILSDSEGRTEDSVIINSIGQIN